MSKAKSNKITTIGLSRYCYDRLANCRIRGGKIGHARGFNQTVLALFKFYEAYQRDNWRADFAERRRETLIAQELDNKVAMQVHDEIKDQRCAYCGERYMPMAELGGAPN